MIKFRETKNFGRIDYVPLTDQARALTFVRGRALNAEHIKALIAAGFVIEIASDN